MKSILKNAALLVVIAAAVVAGCKGKEKTPEGEKEVVIPCSGPDFFTTNKVFRSNSSGESMDMNVAKQKARSNAEGELARSIQVTVKAVTDNYVNSREMNNKEEVEERFEALNRQVVEQTLQGVRIICEKNMKTQQNTYKVYLALELSADDLVKKYNERLSTDERLKIDYDYEKFKDTFEKEMEKRKSGN
jgi:hypothetical protein